ncbi:transposase [Pseudomonas syringae]|uniref:transposase n=1 Tax=Pseudomonas syringae TaxID=317 RepID=UPI001FD30167
MLKRLHIRLNEQGLIDLETWIIDSTAVRATRVSSGAGKKEARRTARPCARAKQGRSDNQDPHAVRRQRCASAFPVFRRAASDIAYAQLLLDEAYISSQRSRSRKRCRLLLADKGYDSEALRRYCDHYRMQPVIRLRDMKRKPKPGLARLFDRPKYRQRNIIERMFGW